MESCKIVPQSAVESFDLCGEDLSRVVLGVWNEILVGLQPVCAIAHRRQMLDLLPKEFSGCDRPSSTGKAEDLAKDGVDR